MRSTHPNSQNHSQKVLKNASSTRRDVQPNGTLATKTTPKKSTTDTSTVRPLSSFAVDRPSEVVLSFTFVVCTALCTIACAFTAGFVGRLIQILNLQEKSLIQLSTIQRSRECQYNHTNVKTLASSSPMPSFSMLDLFKKDFSTTNTCLKAPETEESVERSMHFSNTCSVEGSCSKNFERIQKPVCQHLLIDIENVDPQFLNSETQIARAMENILKTRELTMLSQNCHALQPTGVSCLGVSLGSHISAHTWPSEGIILFDFFTCGSKPLIPLLDLIKDTFAVPKETLSSLNYKEKSAPRMNWAHKRRGFHTDSGGIQGFDLVSHLEGSLEFNMKDKVVSIETEYQTIDVYDVDNPRFLPRNQYLKVFETSVQSNESKHPEFFQLDRQVFVNGVLQSRRYGDSAYHEALVHPALVAHPNPKRIAIIGGGEGATLREVLKHKTVETVTMIEIDEIMVKISKEYLKEWNDCSSFVRGTTAGMGSNCFDNERSELHLTEAGAWFIERFSNIVSIKDEDKFDVVIMDAR